MNDENFWIDDFSILFQKNKLLEFVPTNEMSFHQKLNAVTRFLIYFVIALTLFGYTSEALVFLVMGSIAIIVLNKYRIDIKFNQRGKKKEKTNNHNKKKIKESSQEKQTEPESKYSQQFENTQSHQFEKAQQSEPLIEGPQKKISLTIDDNFLLPPDLLKDSNLNLNEKTIVNDGPDLLPNLEPFSEMGLASVNEVRDAFTPNKGNPGRENLKVQSRDFIENEMKGGNCNANGCSTNGPSPFAAPTCEKGGTVALDANANLCQMPTKDNPFMNLQVTDIVNNTNRLPACDPSIVKNDSSNYWSQNLFRNVNDVWDRNNGQMRFNTENWTTNPNDQDAFKNWLYNVPYVCKDGDMEACYRGVELQTNLRPGKIF